MKTVLSLIKFLHSKYISARRNKVTAEYLSKFLPDRAKVLDIGCGDGAISRFIMNLKPGINIQGVEVLERPNCKIECQLFDGINIPMDDNEVDVSMLVDVLHHEAEFDKLLKEACRVSSKYVLIKDHIYKSKLDFQILKLMDWLGNKAYGVKLVYNYKKKEEWMSYISSNNLNIEKMKDKLRTHPFPLRIVYRDDLHFVALLKKNAQKRKLN